MNQSTQSKSTIKIQNFSLNFLHKSTFLQLDFATNLKTETNKKVSFICKFSTGEKIRKGRLAEKVDTESITQIKSIQNKELL